MGGAPNDPQQIKKIIFPEPNDLQPGCKLKFVHRQEIYLLKVSIRTIKGPWRALLLAMILQNQSHRAHLKVRLDIFEGTGESSQTCCSTTMPKRFPKC